MANNGNSYTVDTKGNCFLCLKTTDDDSSINSFGTPAKKDKVYPVKKVSKFLSLDYQKIFNAALPMLSTQNLEQTEIYVTLCTSCAIQLNYFNDRHIQMEQIQNQLLSTICSFGRIMQDADEDIGRVQAFQQRLTASSAVEIIQQGICANLRIEFRDKCKGQVFGPQKRKKAVPPLRPLQRTTGLKQNQVNLSRAHFPGAHLTMPTSTMQMPFANRPRPPMARRQGTHVGNRMRNPLQNGPRLEPHKQTSPQNKAVMLVDLDDSDTETTPQDQQKEDEELEETIEESDLVISCVSGANGISISPAPTQNLTQTQTVSRSSPSSSNEAPTSSSAIASILAKNSFEIFPVAPSTNTTDDDANRLIPAAAPPSPAPPPQPLSEADSFLESILGPSSFSPPTRVPGTVNELRIEDNFRIFDNGRSQCLICNKIVHQRTRETHKLIHLNQKPIQCIYCPNRFRSTQNLKIHVLVAHRAEMLSSFKKENIPFELFQQVVKNLFHKIIIKKVDGDRASWGCKYCERFYKNKPDLDCHLTQVHSDFIGKELNEMQESISIPISNNSSGADSVKINHQQQTQRQPLSTRKFLNSGRDHLQQQQQPQLTNQDPSLNMKWKCRICHKGCLDKNVLRRHHLFFHSNQKNNSNNYTGLMTKPPANLELLSCVYCNKKFRFNHSIRLHILVSHRFQSFRKYFPQGTSEPTIDSEVDKMLGNLTNMGLGNYGCSFCSKSFSAKEYESSLPQNHILLTHFEELVQKLREEISGGGGGEEEGQNRVHLSSSGNLSIESSLIESQQPRMNDPMSENLAGLVQSSSSHVVNIVKNEEGLSILPD